MVGVVGFGFDVWFGYCVLMALMAVTLMFDRVLYGICGFLLV